jgi:hypothetical protein
VHFKQRAVNEYLVAEKEPVTNKHTRFKKVYGVNALETSSQLGFTGWFGWFWEGPNAAQ